MIFTILLGVPVFIFCFSFEMPQTLFQGFIFGALIDIYIVLNKILNKGGTA